MTFRSLLTCGGAQARSILVAVTEVILGIGGAAGTGKISNRKVLYSLKLGWTHEPYTTIASPLK